MRGDQLPRERWNDVRGEIEARSRQVIPLINPATMRRWLAKHSILARDKNRQPNTHPRARARARAYFLMAGAFVNRHVQPITRE
jgi:hypothetical protein